MLLGASLLACASTSPTVPMPHSADDGGAECETWYQGPTLIDTFTLTCDETEERVVFDLLTVGWAGWAKLFVTGDTGFGTRSEETILQAYEQGHCKAYMRQDAALSTADEARSQDTVFTCADYQGGALTFALGVYDIGLFLEDCAVWGRDPTALVNEPPSLRGPSFDLSACSIGEPGS